MQEEKLAPPELAELSNGPPKMRVARKLTVTKMVGDATVEQTAWVTAKTFVECQFKAIYPQHGQGLPGVTGAIRISFGREIERIRILSRPIDLGQSDALAYDQIAINYLEIKGSYLGHDHAVGFTYELDMKPTFDKLGGWEVAFSEAMNYNHISKMFDSRVTVDQIIASCICTNSVEVSIGWQGFQGMAIRQSFAPVVLRDIEGLRQAIFDVAGEAYLNKLLRMHGYVIDDK